MMRDSQQPKHFPSQLHTMVTTATDSSSTIGWRPHGRCFLIHNEEEFAEKILPKWFPRLKFESFQRLLHKHGFRRLHRKGPDKGAYYHELFQLGKPELAIGIHHVKGEGKRGRKPQGTEPDFRNYASSDGRFSPNSEEQSLIWGVISRTPMDSSTSQVRSGIDFDMATSLGLSSFGLPLVSASPSTSQSSFAALPSNTFPTTTGSSRRVMTRRYNGSEQNLQLSTWTSLSNNVMTPAGGSLSFKDSQQAVSLPSASYLQKLQSQSPSPTNLEAQTSSRGAQQDYSRKGAHLLQLLDQHDHHHHHHQQQQQHQQQHQPQQSLQLLQPALSLPPPSAQEQLEQQIRRHSVELQQQLHIQEQLEEQIQDQLRRLKKKKY